MNDLPENIRKFLSPQGSIENKNNVDEKKDIIDDITSEEKNVTKEVETENNKVEYTELPPIVNPFEEEKTSINVQQLPPQETNTGVIEKTKPVEFEEIKMPSSPFNEQGNELSKEIMGIEEVPQKSIQEQLNDIQYEVKEPSMDELNIDSNYNRIERIEPIKEMELPQEILEVEVELSDEDGELSLPKIINKVRDFTRNLGRASALIDVEEIDLQDKYQITIEIKKN